jgi:hypothetical protein
LDDLRDLIDWTPIEPTGRRLLFRQGRPGVAAAGAV